jgi:hypothetical protein
LISRWRSVLKSMRARESRALRTHASAFSQCTGATPVRLYITLFVHCKKYNEFVLVLV